MRHDRRVDMRGEPSGVTQAVAQTTEDVEPGHRSAIPLILRQVLPGLLVMFVAFRVLRPVQDPDTYWHIEAGRLLSETWDFVTVDPWGAAASLPWIYNQWLPQLLMSWTEERFGLGGIAWLLSLGSAAVIAIVWWTCRRRASSLASVVIAALAALAMMGSLTPRPQLVTFALTAVFVDVWLRTAEDGRARWWLVAVSWVWACSHGMWFLGGLVGLVTVAGMALDHARPPRQLGRLALVPVLCLLAGALTPVGPRLLTSPFQVSEVAGYIIEWQPPSPTSPSLIAVLLLAALPILSGLRTKDRLSWHVVLLLGLTIVLALLYLRTLPIAAAIVAPLAAETSSRVLPREPVARREAVLTASLATLALVVAGFLAVATAGKPGSGPNDLDGPIAALPRGTVVCNESGDGGWLIWKHPNVRVTLDTRVEIYSVEHIEDYARFLRAEPGWQEYPARAGCAYALLPTSEPVVEALTTRLGWSVVATGKNRVLLRRPG
jgi:hypothetical protein